MSGYKLTPLAEADIEAIWDYSEERWGRDQAVRYIGICSRQLKSLPAASEGSRLR